MSIGQPSSLATLNGRYLLREQLGKGGMGAVYRAEDTQTGASVAIKMLSPGAASDTSFLKLFTREVTMLTRLNHPGIVRVFDSGIYQSQPYLVMEYVPGESLAAMEARFGLAPIALALELGVQTASALGAAHRSGITHSDVKPANLLLATPTSSPLHNPVTGWSDDLQVKVVDFGIAQSATTTGFFPTGQVFGTARYMAPEHMTGERVTPATDVYALGLVLYELLTGRTPFPGQTMQEQAMQRLGITPVDPRYLRAEIPPALAGVISRMLARDPLQRYADGDQLAAALRAVQADAMGTTMAGHLLPGFFGRGGSPAINSVQTQQIHPAALVPGSYSAASRGMASLSRLGRKRRPVWLWLLLLLGMFLAIPVLQQFSPHNGSKVPLSTPLPAAPTATAPPLQERATPAPPTALPTQEVTPTATVIQVPNMLLLPLAEAKARLAQAGLHVGSITYVRVLDAQPEIVIRQSASPGSSVPSDSAINLVVTAKSKGNSTGGDNGDGGD